MKPRPAQPSQLDTAWKNSNSVNQDCSMSSSGCIPKYSTAPHSTRASSKGTSESRNIRGVKAKRRARP